MENTGNTKMSKSTACEYGILPPYGPATKQTLYIKSPFGVGTNQYTLRAYGQKNTFRLSHYTIKRNLDIEFGP